MFGASSELVRSWLRTSWCNGIWHEPASNVFGVSSDLASVMEFGFKQYNLYCHVINIYQELNELTWLLDSCVSDVR